MKKLLLLTLSLIILLVFAACGTNSETNSGAIEEVNDETQINTPIAADENLLTMDITMDASLFTDMTEEEIMTAATENGSLKCVINEDGSVTYTMTKAKYKEALSKMKTEIRDTTEGFCSGENKVASFVRIDVNDDCSQFDVYVDPDAYTMWDMMNAWAFELQGVYYQCFAGADIATVDVVVNFINNNTNEIMDTASYRNFVDGE